MTDLKPSTIGDYYERCREKLSEARAELKAAQCPKCFGKGGHYNMAWDEYRGCLACEGDGCAPGYTSADLIRLERLAERVADTGD